MRAKPVVHIRREDLGLRPMQGDAIAQQHDDRWYLTACGVEAPSAKTTNVREPALSVLCADCQEAVDAT